MISNMSKKLLKIKRLHFMGYGELCLLYFSEDIIIYL